MTTIAPDIQARSLDFRIDYGSAIEGEITSLENQLEELVGSHLPYPTRTIAIKLLEGDEATHALVAALPQGDQILSHTERSINSIGQDIDIFIADKRYAWINQLVKESVHNPRNGAMAVSDRIDQILTHPIAGVPIFLALMWFIFNLTVNASAPFLDWTDAVISGPITRWATSLIAFMGLGSTWVESLVADGILAGVGGVLVFVPVLVFLFLALALLEESGYMARMAFVMDRFMQPLGLQGKSFLPLLVGFGCSVPAIYATRTLENREDRILTGLLVPFMSCGARLPVYILLAAIFFPGNSGLIIFGLYLLGIATAIFLGLVLRRTQFKEKENTVMVIELPPYQLPGLKTLWNYISQRVGDFVKNAATIILVTSMVIWLLTAIPVTSSASFADVELQDSAFGRLSTSLSTVFKPLGFGNWQTTGALISGFVAKEVVVSTLAQTYALETDKPTTEGSLAEDFDIIVMDFANASIDTLATIPQMLGLGADATEDETPSDLMTAMRNNFETVSGGHGALAALSLMVFVLIYTPCMAAVAAEKHEFGWRITAASVVGQTLLAWLMAFAVYQGGLLLGLG
ncbi:MAG: ferrous iron transport protein B [Chloroflexi bacterium]|nr:MAG: ferrous iron transport protein B [Chloroflexota bacterium]MBL1194883.1 ferrous iron transport protein B [Chloroflexota bacterium]NOH12174.1 ferrous iron transport protein B [Chloroflexota bacterium]